MFGGGNSYHRLRMDLNDRTAEVERMLKALIKLLENRRLVTLDPSNPGTLYANYFGKVPNSLTGQRADRPTG